MVRTTLNLKPEVLSELKRRARKQGRTLGDVASEELECAFRKEASGRTWPPPGWVTKHMGEPLIPLEDKDALWEFFDREAGLIP
jgi:hypothetical protein